MAGLRKSYGDNEVVRGLDFAIHRGECFGLLGPNGAGKTTTLRCCLGLIDPDAGTITLVGEPVPKAAREARIRVGVVPQMDNLDPDFTVVENLLVYGRYFGIARSDAREAHSAAARIRRPREQRRDVEHPHAVRRHEAAPDAGARAGQRSRAADPRRADHRARPAGAPPDLGRPAPAASQGKTILLTTHFMDEAERLCHAPGGHRPRHADRERHAARADRRARRAGSGRGVRRRGAQLGGRARPRARRALRNRRRDRVLLCEASRSRCWPTWPRSSGVRYLHRPANLEDLFIKLTGRELRD